MQGRHILLGITGGIAAYKAPALVRELRSAGAEVQVVLTRAAESFVTPTSLQAVAGSRVRRDLWDPEAEAAMGHIELARWADLLLVAPATANCMASFAAGRADDLLTTLYLATAAPVAIAPAMNQQMWQHPATVRNLAQLATDGVQVLGPASGEQACGEVGPGRMLEPADIVAALSTTPVYGQANLRGRKILVTAGPTREAIDPVRFLSNHSSGKQGYALAAMAARAGADVTLVSGPVSLATPAGVQRIDVDSARAMYDAVMAAAPAQDVVIGVAAVADYRPAEVATQKIKKVSEANGSTADGHDGSRSIALVENPDIIAGVAALEAGPLVVGFAAETHEALAHARAKRTRKGLDLIVVNDVSRDDIGFGTDHNAATLISDHWERALPRQPKAALAGQVLLAIEELLANVNRATN
ncbi:MAG: bifunctional phosphopantothenoylcysteine decarboxylase/phosphopantothenate--cysteine ligase CoaBC [Pseudomonadota bacterium]